MSTLVKDEPFPHSTSAAATMQTTYTQACKQLLSLKYIHDLTTEVKIIPLHTGVGIYSTYIT